MKFYVKKYLLFPYVLFCFWFSHMILSNALISPVSQLDDVTN